MNNSPESSGNGRLLWILIGVGVLLLSLWFLLNTFVLTTTLADPNEMVLNLPPKVSERDSMPPEKVDLNKKMVLILGPEEKVYYYRGMGDSGMVSTDMSANGIRKVVEDHLARYAKPCSQEELRRGCMEPFFVIRPHEKSTYKNMVDILDEMAIAKAPKYLLDTLTEMDSLLLESEFGIR